MFWWVLETQPGRCAPFRLRIWSLGDLLQAYLSTSNVIFEAPERPSCVSIMDRWDYWKVQWWEYWELCYEWLFWLGTLIGRTIGELWTERNENIGSYERLFSSSLMSSTISSTQSVNNVSAEVTDIVFPNVGLILLFGTLWWYWQSFGILGNIA